MNDRHDTKEWLKAVAAYLNLSLSDLALKSGLAASTVTRYVNDGTSSLTITERSLDAISKFSAIPKNVMPGQRALPGFSESEAVPYDARQQGDRAPEWVNQAIAAHKAGRNGVEPWVMRSWALDLMGVLPGDILMIDQNRRPRAGNIVCVQLTDLASGRTETVMRRYEPPFVLGSSAKMTALRPEVVDDERVIIMGVEDGIIRPRQ